MSLCCGKSREHFFVQPLIATFRPQWIELLILHQGQGMNRCPWRKLFLMPRPLLSQRLKKYRSQMSGNRLLSANLQE
jgi:hypothetical protein